MGNTLATIGRIEALFGAIFGTLIGIGLIILGSVIIYNNPQTQVGVGIFTIIFGLLFIILGWLWYILARRSKVAAELIGTGEVIHIVRNI